MKSVFIILGNGFTIDFLKKYNEYLDSKNKQHVRIDVQNLFQYGEVIGRGFSGHWEITDDE